MGYFLSDIASEPLNFCLANKTMAVY